MGNARVGTNEFKEKCITISIIPTFWQRIMFLFCKCMVVEGSIEEPEDVRDNEMEVSFK